MILFYFQEEVQSNTPATVIAATPKTPPHKTPPKGGAAGPDSNNLKSFFQNLLAKNAPNNNTNANLSQVAQNSNNNNTNSQTISSNDQLRKLFYFHFISMHETK